MGVGRRARVALTLPWILKFSAKQGCFFSFEWEKQISPLMAHPWKKNLEKSLSGPPLEKCFGHP